MVTMPPPYNTNPPPYQDTPDYFISMIGGPGVDIYPIGGTATIPLTWFSRPPSNHYDHLRIWRSANDVGFFPNPGAATEVAGPLTGFPPSYADSPTADGTIWRYWTLGFNTDETLGSDLEAGACLCQQTYSRSGSCSGVSGISYSNFDSTNFSPISDYLLAVEGALGRTLDIELDGQFTDGVDTGPNWNCRVIIFQGNVIGTIWDSGILGEPITNPSFHLSATINLESQSFWLTNFVVRCLVEDGPLGSGGSASANVSFTMKLSYMGSSGPTIFFPSQPASGGSSQGQIF